MKWSYDIEGKGRSDAVWKVTGQMEVLPGHFPIAVQDVLKETFFALTEGRAEYPNQDTCQGPYRILKLKIELVEDQKND